MSDAPVKTLELHFIRVFDMRDGSWRTLDNGSFPITADELRRARDAYAERAERLADVDVVNGAPQTVAREVLKKLLPALGAFDLICLGFVVTNPRIEFDNVRWPTHSRLKALAERMRCS